MYNNNKLRASFILVRRNRKLFYLPLLSAAAMGTVGINRSTFCSISSSKSVFPHHAIQEDHTAVPRNIKSTWLSKLLQTGATIMQIILRALYLGAVFSPAVLTFFPLKLISFIQSSSSSEALWWDIFRYCICMSGPCITKFCQWVSVRPDLFPLEVCKNLRNLQAHTRAPPYKKVEKMLRRSYKDSTVVIQRDTSTGEPVVLGSGCVAQVFRGTLIRPSEKEPVEIAVKVTHPDIRGSIIADIQLLKFLASSLETIWPASRSISLCDSVNEFSGLMVDQLDMRKEATNLAQFTLNFQESEQSDVVDVSSLFLKLMTAVVHSLESWQRSGGGSGSGSKGGGNGGAFRYTNRVAFPQPMVDLTSQDILVESCEEGPLLSHLLLVEDERRDGGDEVELDTTLKKKIAKIGLHTIFKMIFIDNFIHADLHPGNIVLKNTKGPERDFGLCFLDAGLVVTLTPADKRNFEDLFLAVVRNEGALVGRLMVERSRTGGEGVLDPDGFAREIAQLVGSVHASGLSLGKVGIGSVLTSVLQLCYKHQVRLEARYSSLIVALGMMEGIGRQLDPEVDIMHMAAPYVLHAVANRAIEMVTPRSYYSS